MNEDALLRLETRHRAELARLAEERKREREEDYRRSKRVAVIAAVLSGVAGVALTKAIDYCVLSLKQVHRNRDRARSEESVEEPSDEGVLSFALNGGREEPSCGGGGEKDDGLRDGGSVVHTNSAPVKREQKR